MNEKMGQQFPDKEKYVQEVFHSIAPVYDRMNMVMSLGLVRSWRQAMLKLSCLRQGERALDVGTGTGELAFLLARRVGPEGAVQGLDFSPRMLETAQRRMARKVVPHLSAPIVFIQGNALALPFAPESFNLVTSAFVLRNVTDIPLAVREMARVCQRDGQVICLDISRPKSLLGWGFDLYFGGLIPLLGRLIGQGRVVRGRDAAYTWLSKSLQNFPQGQDMVRIFEASGLQEVSFHPLSGGLSTIYIGKKR